MVCGKLLVDRVERWCELQGASFRVYEKQPVAEMDLRSGSVVVVGEVDGERHDGGGGAHEWVVGDCVVAARCESDKAYWLDCLARAQGEAAQQLAMREQAVEQREIELLWRAHEVTVMEETARLPSSSLPYREAQASSASSRAISAENPSSRTTSPAELAQAACGTPGIRQKIADLSRELESLHEQLRANSGPSDPAANHQANTTPRRRQHAESPRNPASDRSESTPASTPSTTLAEAAGDGVTGVLADDARHGPSCIEVLDSPSPVKVRRHAAARAGLNSSGRPAAAAGRGVRSPEPAERRCWSGRKKDATRAAAAADELRRVVMQVPGKTVAISPVEAEGEGEGGSTGLLLEVNGHAVGCLTWLGYDDARKWLTTGTDTMRSGIAVPPGAEGAKMLRLLSRLAEAAGLRHNLPTEHLRVGDRVRTTKFLRYASGKNIPCGSQATVVSLSAKSNSVRVRSAAGNVFSTSRAFLEPVGRGPADLPTTSHVKDEKLAAYIAANLDDDERQEELFELDNELDALLQVAAEV